MIVLAEVTHRSIFARNRLLEPGGRATMNKLILPSVMAVAAASLAGDAPAPARSISPETIAALDPTRLAGSMCGSRRGGAALRARLRLAAAVTQAAAPAPANMTPVPDSIRFAVTSADPAVREHVRRGLLLAYGFNHEAAIAEFRAGQQRDPRCAICFWGEAYALGPNINAPMTPEALPQARAALARAMALREGASATERTLIEALAGRYAGDDRAVSEAAYADAMHAAAGRFSADDDVAVIAAEAAMNTRPWDYWELDGRTPKPRIGEAIRLVETVLARSPRHPQAQHLYIHLIEASAAPGRAEAAADRLSAADITGAGHLVHMPAHIYFRLGRFGDSIRANVVAARADEAYLATAGPNPAYRFGYYPHNVHFLVASAQMAGDMATATSEARRLARILNPEISMQLGWLQPVQAAPYMAFAQFAAPERILTLPEADARLPYVVAIRHYARAVARAAQQDRAGFDAELAALRDIREGTGVQPLVDQGVPARDLLTIAEQVALGRWESAAGRHGAAVRAFEAAAEVEARIPYMEPPFWYYPVHQSLGAALFRAGRLDAARAAFRTALVRAPNNGWALYGLAETERALGHRPEAAAARAALARAWLGDRRWLRMDRL
jgi:tetratricopeptide (TPR) repeat protein